MIITSMQQAMSETIEYPSICVPLMHGRPFGSYRVNDRDEYVCVANITLMADWDMMMLVVPLTEVI